MCGIFFYKGNNFSKEDLLSNFNKIINRGPDKSKLINIDNNIFGFHRLAINDLSDNGMQPFIHDNIYLICNGEIYNHNNLKEKYNINTISNSDCEVIIHLYKLLGIEETCKLLDGVFSFVLYDKDKDIIYVARDPYGVRPLFLGNTSDGDYVFSSELKGLNNLVKNAEQFQPGSYMIISNYISESNIELDILENTYHSIQIFNHIAYNDLITENEILESLNSKSLS